MNGRWTSATRFLCVVALGLSVGLGAAYGANATPQYSIQAILFGTSPDVPVAELAMGGPKDVKIEIAVAIWLIRGGGHTILFDSGFHRDTFAKRFPTNDYTDARHTYASEYLRIDGHTDYVLASDNVSVSQPDFASRQCNLQRQRSRR
jgi:hypothetical protein